MMQAVVGGAHTTSMQEPHHTERVASVSQRLKSQRSFDSRSASPRSIPPRPDRHRTEWKAVSTTRLSACHFIAKKCEWPAQHANPGKTYQTLRFRRETFANPGM